MKEDVSALEELNDSSQRHSSIGKMLSKIIIRLMKDSVLFMSKSCKFPSLPDD